MNKDLQLYYQGNKQEIDRLYFEEVLLLYPENLNIPFQEGTFWDIVEEQFRANSEN